MVAEGLSNRDGRVSENQFCDFVAEVCFKPLDVDHLVQGSRAARCCRVCSELWNDVRVATAGKSSVSIVSGRQCE